MDENGLGPARPLLLVATAALRVERREPINTNTRYCQAGACSPLLRRCLHTPTHSYCDNRVPWKRPGALESPIKALPAAISPLGCPACGAFGADGASPPSSRYCCCCCCSSTLASEPLLLFWLATARPDCPCWRLLWSYQCPAGSRNILLPRFPFWDGRVVPAGGTCTGLPVLGRQGPYIAVCPAWWPTPLPSRGRSESPLTDLSGGPVWQCSSVETRRGKTG